MISFARSSGKMKEASKASKNKKGKDEEKEVIQADFNFFDPQELDYQSIRNLTRNYLTSEYDDRELADMIVNQVSVGTMVKNEEAEEAPLGFITALNLQYYKVPSCCIFFLSISLSISLPLSLSLSLSLALSLSRSLPPSLSLSLSPSPSLVEHKCYYI